MHLSCEDRFGGLVDPMLGEDEVLPHSLEDTYDMGASMT